jgi:hypothetical protein
MVNTIIERDAASLGSAILSEEDAEQGLQTQEATFSEVEHGKASHEKITRIA